jgi:stress response protein YsnF
MTHAVIGIFDDRSEAEAAMSELTARGFTSSDIDISRRAQGTTGAGTGSAAGSTGTGITGTGTTQPGISGGTGSTRTGYDSTDQSRTDYDDNDSFGDKVSNFFNSLFGDDSDEASRYSSIASDADAILTVQTDSEERARIAAEIMDDNGAIDVDDRATRTGFTGSRGSSTDTDVISGRTGYDRDTQRTGENLNIPVVEENLHVGKRQVEGGGVRVRSRIVEKPVEEHVRLREEHVNVNRRPVDRAVGSGELENFKEGEFEIRERAEQAVVSKDARVKEEISINKNVEERDEVVRDTVRSTDVDVEKLGRDARTTAGNRAATTDDDDDLGNSRSRGARG